MQFPLNFLYEATKLYLCFKWDHWAAIQLYHYNFTPVFHSWLIFMWFCLQKLWKSITVLLDTFFGFYWFSHGKIPGLSSKIHLRRLFLSGRWNESDTCVMFTISSLPITVLFPKCLIPITNVKPGLLQNKIYRLPATVTFSFWRKGERNR